MKAMKRSLSILLALLLMLSLAMPAFAEGSAEQPYDFYFLIGDSIPNSNALDLPNATGYLGFRIGSYPELIAKHYNFPDAYNGAQAGWRMQEVRILLDDNYEGDDFTLNYEYRWGGDTLDSLKARRDEYRENLQKADLITVHLGSNNLMGILSYSTIKTFDDQTAGTEFEKYALAVIDEALAKNSEREAIVTILEAVRTIGQYKIFIDTLAKDLIGSLADYAGAWDAMIRLIREYNPEADIAVIGLYNPVAENQKVGAEPNDLLFALYDALEEIVDPMFRSLNCYMSTKSPYASEYVYVDVTDVDMEGSRDGAHLGAAGHKYVADSVIAAVDRGFLCRHGNTERVNAVAATKLSLGRSGDLVCADCGKLLEKSHVTVYQCTHEKTVLVGAVPATHLSLGFTGSTLCADCGKILETGHVIGFKLWK